jgi:hypothetical protein
LQVFLANGDEEGDLAFLGMEMDAGEEQTVFEYGAGDFDGFVGGVGEGGIVGDAEDGFVARGEKDFNAGEAGGEEVDDAGRWRAGGVRGGAEHGAGAAAERLEILLELLGYEIDGDLAGDGPGAEEAKYAEQ